MYKQKYLKYKKKYLKLKNIIGGNNEIDKLNIFLDSISINNNKKNNKILLFVGRNKDDSENLTKFKIPTDYNIVTITNEEGKSDYNIDFNDIESLNKIKPNSIDIILYDLSVTKFMDHKKLSYKDIYKYYEIIYNILKKDGQYIFDLDLSGDISNLNQIYENKYSEMELSEYKKLENCYKSIIHEYLLPENLQDNLKRKELIEKYLEDIAINFYLDEKKNFVCDNNFKLHEDNNKDEIIKNELIKCYDSNLKLFKIEMLNAEKQEKIKKITEMSKKLNFKCEFFEDKPYLFEANEQEIPEITSYCILTKI
jgi:hypothetical protein